MRTVHRHRRNPFSKSHGAQGLRHRSERLPLKCSQDHQEHCQGSSRGRVSRTQKQQRPCSALQAPAAVALDPLPPAAAPAVWLCAPLSPLPSMCGA